MDDIDTGKRRPENLVASKDGRWLAFSDDMTMDVSLWELKSGSVVQTMKVRGSGTESVDTSALVAAFASPASVDTASEMPDLRHQSRWTPRRWKWPVSLVTRGAAHGPAPRCPRP